MDAFSLFINSRLSTVYEFKRGVSFKILQFLQAAPSLLLEGQVSSDPDLTLMIFSKSSFLGWIYYKRWRSYAPIRMLSRGEGVRAGVGILTFCPKYLSKTTSPGQSILSKKKSLPKGRGVMSNVPTQRQCYSF